MSQDIPRLTPLKIIPTTAGDVLHALSVDDIDFTEFGEAYFSLVNFGCVKGWKKHLRADCNLFVPFGCVRFYLKADDDKIRSFEIGPSSYSRLFLPSGSTFAFKGIFHPYSIVLNICSLKHDPSEVISYDINAAELTLD